MRGKTNIFTLIMIAICISFEETRLFTMTILALSFTVILVFPIFRDIGVIKRPFRCCFSECDKRSYSLKDILEHMDTYHKTKKVSE